MHPNAALIERLYGCLVKGEDEHKKIDYNAMAECYHPDATFEDIAFKLSGKNQITAMWHMISETNLRATFKIACADDEGCQADLVDEYTFSDTGNRVRNPIHSGFKFKDCLIISHRDVCNAWSWGRQALGPVKGTIVTLLPFLRRRKAMEKLEPYIAMHQ